MPDPSRAAGEAATWLARDAVDCLPEGALAAKLSRAAAEGRPLRVKLGIDPTAPDIHLGHVVVLRKLREFQDLGHRVVLIVGDYTGLVGDPSGRSATRPVLEAEELRRNALTFHEQAFRVLDRDPNRVELRNNSEWLDMPMASFLSLTRMATVSQLLERDDFAGRHARGEPISILELLYPLMQGYDSVAVGADVELGGTDQTFNLLLGRQVQRAHGQEEQAILTMPILVGTDGHEKMSKSLGNHIAVTDPPDEMYGKTMRIPDEVLDEYYRLALGNTPPVGVAPRDAKRALARALVGRFYGESQAQAAERHFDRVFVEHGVPEEVPEATYSTAALTDSGNAAHVPAVLSEVFGISRSEGRRLLDQGGVHLDGRTLGSEELDLPVSSLDGALLRAGKRRFRRLRAPR